MVILRLGSPVDWVHQLAQKCFRGLASILFSLITSTVSGPTRHRRTRCATSAWERRRRWFVLAGMMLALLGGCWIGPSDLARSMGVDRTTSDGAAAHRQMILRVAEACRKTGKIAGISGDLDISFWLQNGFKFVTASYDGGLLLEGAKHVFDLLAKHSIADA